MALNSSITVNNQETRKVIDIALEGELDLHRPYLGVVFSACIAIQHQNLGLLCY